MKKKWLLLLIAGAVLASGCKGENMGRGQAVMTQETAAGENRVPERERILLLVRLKGLKRGRRWYGTAFLMERNLLAVSAGRHHWIRMSGRKGFPPRILRSLPFSLKMKRLSERRIA